MDRVFWSPFFHIVQHERKSGRGRSCRHQLALCFILYLITLPILLAVIRGIPGCQPNSETRPDAASMTRLGAGNMALVLLLAFILGTVAMGTSLY